LIDKLKQLEQNLIILEKIKKDYSLEDIQSDKIDEWGLRYGLLESIQIIIDISCHLVAEKNLGVPKSYSDCINLLITNKYLDADTGKKVIRMVGLRNLLVHDYGIVNLDKLFSYLDNLGDIKDFINQISLS